MRRQRPRARAPRHTCKEKKDLVGDTIPAAFARHLKMAAGMLAQSRTHLLKEEHQDGNEHRPLLLQREEGPRRPDKQLAVAVSNVVLETMLLDDGGHGVPVRGHQVLWPGELARHLIPVDGGRGEMSITARPPARARKQAPHHPPLQEAGVGLAVGEARPAHHHVLQQAQVGHLVLAAGLVEQNRGLQLVGFDAAHVVGFLRRTGEEPF